MVAAGRAVSGLSAGSVRAAGERRRPCPGPGSAVAELRPGPRPGAHHPQPARRGMRQRSASAGAGRGGGTGPEGRGPRPHTLGSTAQGRNERLWPRRAFSLLAPAALKAHGHRATVCSPQEDCESARLFWQPRRAGLTAILRGTKSRWDSRPAHSTVASAFSALCFCWSERESASCHGCHGATTQSTAFTPSPTWFFFFFSFLFPLLLILLLFSCLERWSLFLVFLKFYFCYYCSAKLLPCPHRVEKVEKHLCLRCLRGHFSVCGDRQILFDGYRKTKVVKISWKERGNIRGPVCNTGSVWQRLWYGRQGKGNWVGSWMGRREEYFQPQGSSPTKNNFTDLEKINWF